MFLRSRGSIAVAIAFAVPLAMLLATVRRSVGFWDTGDLQTVAWIAGIPYPTGFPLYVMAGWVWTHALPVASAATRLNALSATAIACGAATVCACALVFDVAAVLAVLGGWLFAFSAPVWLRGTYADAHPLGFALAFVAAALALRWAVRGDGRALTGAILAAAVAVAVDNTTVLILAGVVVAACTRRPPLVPVLRAAALGVLIVVASYAYLPLRSAAVSAARVDPTLALGVPPGRPFWDDHHPSEFSGFVALVSGSAFAPGASIAALATPEALDRTARRFGPQLGDDFPYGLVLVGLVGLVVIASVQPVAGIGLLLVALLPSLFGASYRAEADPERYVFALYAVCALGVAVAADRGARLMPARMRGVALGVAALVLAAAGAGDIARSSHLFAWRDIDETGPFTAAVVQATRDGAVIVAPWNEATPLAYRAYVDGALGTRIVVCGFAGDYADLYDRWLRAHQVAIVSDVPPEVGTHRTRLLVSGEPSVYELLP